MTESTPPEPNALPYVFLDVDGVLNALHPPREPHDHEMLTVGGRDFPIHIRHTVSAWLRTLGERSDVRWATTWEDHANDVLCPAFGLPAFPVVCRDDAGVDVTQRRSAWKLAGVVATVQAEPRPFVWIDDVEIPRSTEEHFDHLGVPYRCVRPHPNYGLSNRHMRDVDAFLADPR